MAEHSSVSEPILRHDSGVSAHSATSNGTLIVSGAFVLRPLALFFRVVSLVLIAAGIVRITGIFGPDPGWASFTFYTVQSNVLCLIWMVLLVLVTVRDIGTTGPRGHSTPSARWSAAIMMAITITMLVYLIVLVPATFVQDSGYVPFSLTDNLIHIITPCLLIVDWLLFVPKGRVRGFDPLLWAGIPLLYLVFAFTYSGLGGEFSPGQRYPYPFLDVDAHGVVGVVLRVLALAVALIGVGYAYFGLDRVLSRRARSTTPHVTTG
ncbi:MAG: Pr6Pr family membrane protein [Leucobacter sp.]|nr:Pr6Pr family membrane protein [Leucobacter sp.]